MGHKVTLLTDNTRSVRIEHCKRRSAGVNRARAAPAREICMIGGPCRLLRFGLQKRNLILYPTAAQSSSAEPLPHDLPRRPDLG